jgi:starch synthase (maltosyl-transferring)
VIQDIQSAHPDVIFFAEAFTRPTKMKYLAKVGFTTSYTYFTWKNTAWELRDYLTELTQSPMVEYYRGVLFANTPDILHEYLVEGGPPAFRIRLLLAATLLPSFGIYSGFELFENVPLRPGSEEYLDSEKYQLRQRNWDTPESLDDEIALLNGIRREHPALQRYDNLRFLPSDNDRVLCYLKRAPSDAPDADDLLIAVTTDPHDAQETVVHVPIAELGIEPEAPYIVHDLLTGKRYSWRGERNYARLDPAVSPGHLFRIER